MSKLPSWDELSAGSGCPLDYPRPHITEFNYFVRKLPVSSLYLSHMQAYRGACMLAYDVRHVVRIDQLSAQEWQKLAADLWSAQSAICRALRPDHVNVESLGNVVPHLHWHIVPRYKDDGRWGLPIWTTRLEEMREVRLSSAEYAALAERINRELDPILPGR